MANTTCSKCGCVYPLLEEYEVDTWNLGHYGCNMNNAPRIFKGYKDPGCPHCLKYENELPFEEFHTIPYPVNIQLGKMQTHREMKDGKLIVTQEQKMEFNIDFTLVEDYLPITLAQESTIDKIEWNTNHKFKGKSREDAAEFISKHMSESIQKAAKRQAEHKPAYPRHSNMDDDDCDWYGLDASMFY